MTFMHVANNANKELTRSKLPLPSSTRHKQLPVDHFSLALYSNDIDNGMSPRIVYGYGNCLFRAGAYFIWGNQENHREVSVRIIIEMAMNEDIYLNDGFLSSGLLTTASLSKHN